MNRIFKSLAWGVAFVLAALATVALGFFTVAHRKDELAQIFGWLSWLFLVSGFFASARTITRAGLDQENEIDRLIKQIKEGGGNEV